MPPAACGWLGSNGIAPRYRANGAISFNASSGVIMRRFGARLRDTTRSVARQNLNLFCERERDGTCPVIMGLIGAERARCVVHQHAQRDNVAIRDVIDIARNRVIEGRFAVRAQPQDYGDSGDLSDTCPIMQLPVEDAKFAGPRITAVLLGSRRHGYIGRRDIGPQRRTQAGCFMRTCRVIQRWRRRTGHGDKAQRQNAHSNSHTRLFDQKYHCG